MTTREEAATAVKNIILKNVPRTYLWHEVEERDFRFFANGERVTIIWRTIAFGVEVPLRVGLDEEPSITWGGMQRSLANAAASLVLYRQALDFAMALECVRRELMKGVK
jgi:hypothetical protein